MAKHLDRVRRALQPWNTHMMSVMPPNVLAVAHDKQSASVACITSHLRWPDRNQPRAYVLGQGLMEPDAYFVFKDFISKRDEAEKKRQ